MFCPNCGKNVADGVKFCPECGSEVKPVQSSPVTAASITPVGGSFVDNVTAKIEGFLPKDKQKRNYVSIGLAVLTIIFLIVTYSSFTSIEGRWQMEYEFDVLTGRREYPELGEVLEVEFDGDIAKSYDTGKLEDRTPYSTSGDRLIVGGESFRYECNGFSMTMAENEIEHADGMEFSRVWTFGFVLKLLFFLALAIVSGFAAFIVYKSNKRYEAPVDTTGYTL